MQTKKSHGQFRPLWTAAALLLLVAASVLRAESDAAAQAAQGGELLELHGQRVLRLKGTDVMARGFAHGYFLAPDFVMQLEAAISSLPHFDAKQYENQFLPWMRENFVWDADANAEFDGIYAGMKARLGETGTLSKLLGRAMTREDLMGINTVADYFGPACSAFTAWGPRTPDGQLVHGRTLDFPIGEEAVRAQVLSVNEALPDRGAGRPARKAFVAVAWPGMIAHYTGMNEAGLVACIHDGYNVTTKTRKGGQGGCLPRGLMLRRVLEGVDPAASDAAVQGAKLIGEYNSACGNLFHLSWPMADAKKLGIAPSAVLEFDPPRGKQPAVIRRPDADGFMVLTNHFCVLNSPIPCARCAHITEGIELLDASKRLIGLPEARKLLMAAEQPVAAHSVYFYPDSMVFHLSITRKNIMSPRVIPVKFTWAELAGPAR